MGLAGLQPSREKPGSLKGLSSLWMSWAEADRRPISAHKIRPGKYFKGGLGTSVRPSPEWEMLRPSNFFSLFSETRKFSTEKYGVYETPSQEKCHCAVTTYGVIRKIYRRCIIFHQTWTFFALSRILFFMGIVESPAGTAERHRLFGGTFQAGTRRCMREHAGDLRWPIGLVLPEKVTAMSR
jgi:hypothetical protein